MASHSIKNRGALQLHSTATPLKGALCGWIAAVDAEGRILVDFEGNPAGPIAARSVVEIHPGDLPADGTLAPILIEFERGDPSAPIIVGLLREARITPDAATEPARFGGTLDGERLVFEARREIVLRCGEGSIVLQADGRIVIKGSRLLSRATEANRIRGSSVAIN